VSRRPRVQPHARGEEPIEHMNRGPRVRPIAIRDSAAYPALRMPRRRATVSLASKHSTDPTPDLAVLSPNGSRIFVSLRGPVPLSGDPHAPTGATPGLGVIQVTAGGRMAS
jgi:hypothetical protein